MKLSKVWLAAGLFALSVSAVAIENLTPTQYTTGTVSIGETVYIDRAYVFTDVGVYGGYEFVRAKNSDRSTATIRFTHSGGPIYLAVDTRTGPSTGWASTGDLVKTDDTVFDVYTQDVPAGDVSIVPTCKPSTRCSMHIVMIPSGPPLPPAVPFVGGATVSWFHDYKSVPDAEGIEHDIDVLKYYLYRVENDDRSLIRAVADDDSGAISTELAFPDDVSVPNGTEFCVSVSAVAVDNGSDVESERTEPVCALLENDTVPVEPQVIPVPPEGVTIEVQNVGGTLNLILEPTE